MADIAQSVDKIAVPKAPAPLSARTTKRIWTPAAIVVGLAVALILVMFGIFAVLCVAGYQSTIDGAKAKAQSAADVVGDEVQWSLSAGLGPLKMVAARIADPSDLTAADVAAINAALSGLPGGVSVALYDANGTAEPDARSASLPASIAGTDYFAAVAAGGSWFIGKQVKNAATAAPTIVMAQRLGGATFTGAVVLSMPGALLQSFWEPQKLGDMSTVIVVRDDGWMVGRYPMIADPIDVSKTAAQWSTISTQDRGTYSTTSPIDNVNRVVGYAHVRSLGLIVFAAVSLDAVLAPLWTSIITVLWLMGPIALGLLIFALITARILMRSARTQASLAAAVAHNEVLFREIHHRVKNNLQSVASLLQMQPIPREVKVNMGQRIAAMSAVHEHIYRSDNFATVRVKTYLETLIGNIRAGADPNVSLVETLEDVAVDKDVATPLGLIVNEVVANAFKHAFPDGRGGAVTISLRDNGSGRGELVVEDNGVGFDPSSPGKGIGRRLITALTQQLGGEAGFASPAGGGSIFTLTFPLAQQA